MFVADNKIRYWKKKYQKKVKCEFCKQKPCCLDGGMKSLLQDRGEDLQNVISIDNKATRYQLYHTAARCFFGYLGWGNRKELPKCIVDYIRYLHPKKKLKDTVDLFLKRHFTTPLLHINIVSMKKMKK